MPSVEDLPGARDQVQAFGGQSPVQIPIRTLTAFRRSVNPPQPNPNPAGTWSATPPGREPVQELPPPPPRSFLSRLRAWRVPPAVALVALSITLAEILTGSTPVAALVDPLVLLELLGLYGAGALLIRDLSIRWGNGWVSIFLLGFAYAIAEEGIATKTLVDPSRPSISYLGSLLHAGGINWGVVAGILPFHALYSIGLPILLVELLFPETRGRRFLGNRGLVGAFIALATTVTIGYFGFDPHYFEGYPVLGLLLLVLVAFVVLAWKLPGRILLPSTPRPTRAPRWFLAVGAGYAAAWAFFDLLFPGLTPFPGLMILGEAVSAPLAILLVRRHLGREENDREKMDLALGLLSWYVPWVVLLVILGDALALIPFVLLFAVLWHRRSRRNGIPSGAAAS